MLNAMLSIVQCSLMPPFEAFSGAADLSHTKHPEQISLVCGLKLHSQTLKQRNNSHTTGNDHVLSLISLFYPALCNCRIAHSLILIGRYGHF